MKSQRIVWLTLVGVLVSVLLAACYGGTVGGTKAPTSSGGKANNVINVSATEFEFKPNHFEGKVGQKLTFKVANKGTLEHAFAIMSLDGSEELTKLNVQPGETKSLEFTPTAAATYPIYCTIAGHKENNMTGELVVK